MIRDIFDIITDVILVHARFALARHIYRVLHCAQAVAYRAETWAPGRVAGCRCDYATRDECQNGGVLSDCPCPCHIDAADPFEVRLRGEPVEDDRVDEVRWTPMSTLFKTACRGGVERAGGAP